MKVALFAVLKQQSAADTAARQSIYNTFLSLSDDVEPFLSFEDAKTFYAEMGKSFGRADVIVAAANEGAFLEQKWNMLKALGLKSEICPAVLQTIRTGADVSDTSMKAHALMPKEAAIFLTHDGLFSGFAVESGKQTLLYLPMIDGRTQDILAEGVQRYFAARMQLAEQAAPPAPQIDIPDNNERFIETAKILADCDVSVAFAATQTIRYVQNGVRANPLFGDAFIPANVEDDPSSRDSATERMACLADSARKEIGTTLGAAISNVYTVGNGSKDMFLYVALADKNTSHVRKITGPSGISAAGLVSLATDTLYTMLQDYAGGKPFPPEETEITPINLFEDGMQSAQENKQQKSGTAVKIAVCVLIAIILCVLIGFYFKDEVAAFFDGARNDAPAMAASIIIEHEDATVAEPLTEPEETTEAFMADVDPALFGTAYAGSKTGIAALSAYETPVYVNLDTEIRDYTPAVQDVTYTTTPTTAATTAATTSETTVETTTAASTTEKPTTTTTTKPAAKKTEQTAADDAETTAKPTETTTEKETARSTTKVITAATKATTTTEPTTTTTTAPETTTKSLLENLFGTATSDGTFTFTVYGYGHGVGMSQLGAIAYARQGWTYDAIVQHYYPGAALATETPPESISYGGKTRETRDFLVRVVQQEIGGTAKIGDIEALKAQTVAVYSFLKAKGYTLSSGDVAYSTLADSSLSSVVRSAVDSVFGTYLSYGGKPVLATFYASSAGKTTSAKSVWGGNYAYLSGGVTSPEQVSVTTVRISAEDFKSLIARYNAAHPTNMITLSGSPSQWIEILGHDGARGDVGYISSIRVGDKVMNGNAFRTMFNTYRADSTAGIRSHCFSVSM